MTSINLPSWMDRWNRKFHIYLGLALLWFLWVFSISGLLLNHSAWQFADFWPQRKQSSTERGVHAPREIEDVPRAKDVMKQLGITGEIEWTSTNSDPDKFDFRIVKPGQILEVKSDFKLKRASVQRIETNGWGTLKMLHTFTGVRADDHRARRDWWLTNVWGLSMDTVALGLIALPLTGFYQWFRSRRLWAWGTICLVLGTASCAFFLRGLL